MKRNDRPMNSAPDSGAAGPSSGSGAPDAGPPSDRSRVRRMAERADYSRDTIYSILDEGLVAHVGVAVGEQPFVIPMGYGRDGDHLILHGAVASRLLRAAKAGAPICVTVTHLDGLVLARSVFHHSMNYRSVVVLGVPELVEGPEEKRAALDALTEHLIPGRTAEARGPNDRELALTLVLRLSLEEASAKIRTGPPGDEPEDYELPIWAGVIPMTTTFGEPEADPQLADGIPTAESARSYRRP